jgi:hypothetical protein
VIGVLLERNVKGAVKVALNFFAFRCSISCAGKPIDAKDLGKIEGIVSQQIRDGMTVYAKEASLAEAKRIMGLRAVFGEVSVKPAAFNRMSTSCQADLTDVIRCNIRFQNRQC